VDNLSAAHGERRAFTSEEIDALLAAASPDWQTAIRIARGTGFRLSDATGLRWDQFDAERGVIVHRPKKEARHRAAKKRETVCPSDLLAWLRAHQGVGSAPITPTLYGRPTNRKNGLSAEFARVLDKANVTIKTVGGAKRKVSDVSFHSLRHTAASELANAGVSADRRKAQLGHTSDRVHSGYVHHDTDTMRAELDRATTHRTKPAVAV
jgi:integrase